MPLSETQPVFIGGCGRSGTTLLGSILGAHSDCLCVPESPFKTDLLRVFDPAVTPAKQILEAITETRRFRVWGLGAYHMREMLAGFDGTYAEGLNWLVNRYGVKVQKPSPRMWVDHTPSNVRSMVTLAQLFPMARFIHIVRDGRGVAASILPLDWGPNSIDEAAHWWTEAVAYGLGAETWGGDDRVMRVRYEDLVEDSENTVQKICRWLSIEFQPAMLDANGFRVPGYTARQHALIGRAPESTRASAWKATLSPRHIEIFESLAGELLKYLGYDLQFGVLARKATRTERLQFAVQRFCCKYVVNKVRLKYRRARML